MGTDKNIKPHIVTDIKDKVNNEDGFVCYIHYPFHRKPAEVTTKVIKKISKEI